MDCYDSLCTIASLEKHPLALFDWFRKNKAPRIEETIKKLFEHKLSGYYFLERLRPGNELEGHVCLLREVTSLSKEVAEGLIKGLSKHQWEEIIRVGVAQNLDFSNEDFACPISQICPSSNHLRPLCALANGVSGPSAVEVKLRFGDASSGAAGWFCA